MIVDADRIAREVVEPGTPGLAAVVAEFGDGDPRPPTARWTGRSWARSSSPTPSGWPPLNAIVHPLVGARSAGLEAARRARTRSVVHDVPLLTENGLARCTTWCWSSTPSPETQLDRLVRLRGMTEDEARARMAAQATREERLAVADIVIDNDGPLEELEPRVREVWDALRGEPRLAAPMPTAAAGACRPGPCRMGGRASPVRWGIAR